MSIEQPGETSFRLFGDFIAQIGGQPMPTMRFRKDTWLLCLLLLKAGTRVEREWLAAMLWPESEPSLARFYVRRSLCEINKALGTDRWRIQAPSRSTLSFNLDGAVLDTKSFDDAVRRKDPASLEQAVALYCGPLLARCDEAWILDERHPREKAYCEALETLSEDALAHGNWSEAEKYARLLIDTDPVLYESAFRTLMTSMAERDRHPAVIKVYRDLRVLLWDKLSTEPDELTQRLFKHLLENARKRARRSSLPKSVPLHNSLASEERARDRTYHSKPFTSIFGRDDEVDRIVDRLRNWVARSRRPDERSPFILLHGPGGIGKTRLAEEVGIRIEHEGHDVVFVSLAAVTMPDRVAEEITKALGLPPPPGISAEEQLIKCLRGTPCVIILDNIESLLPAGEIPDILQTEIYSTLNSLWSNLPSACWLVTSRENIEAEGITSWNVGELDLPDETLGFDALRYNPCFQLFEAYAKDGFEVSDENWRDVAELCQYCGGMPLAIKIVASRGYTAMDLLAAEPSWLAYLRSVAKNDTDRHATMHMCIKWSYDRLDPDSRRLLGKLFVFRGSFTHDTANEIFGEPQAEKLLDTLCHYSLASKDMRSRRYYLLEPIKQFARGCLSDREQVDLEADFARYFLQQATELDKNILNDSKGIARLVTKMAAEEYNLDAALDIMQRADGTAALEFVGALWRFWAMRGYMRQGVAKIMKALQTTNYPDPPESLTVRLNTGVAALLYLQGRRETHDKAKRISRETIDLARKIHSDWEITILLLIRAAVEGFSEETKMAGSARSIFEEAIASAKDDRWLQALTFDSFAFYLLNIGEAHEADGYFAKTKDILFGTGGVEGVQEHWLVGTHLTNLGIYALKIKHAALEAQTLLLRALGMRAALNDVLGIAECYYCLAGALLESGGANEAAYPNAALMIGAAKRLLSEMEAEPWPGIRMWCNEIEQDAKDKLDGVHPALWADKIAEGKSMRPSEALMFAVGVAY